MPCFEPVMMMEVGEGEERMVGRKVEMPFMTPKRFVSKIYGGGFGKLVVWSLR